MVSGPQLLDKVLFAPKVIELIEVFEVTNQLCMYIQNEMNVIQIQCVNQFRDSKASARAARGSRVQTATRSQLLRLFLSYAKAGVRLESITITKDQKSFWAASKRSRKI